ncbi:MAG: hypothetical protein Ct9H90mP20_4350 [Candidatus Neomarinimicrobiota bacterium]|nr:MAG: hypothetical protein Ct9H90mP20_4350 [Candidatus Neomarinimicrobiota bacterium]
MMYKIKYLIFLMILFSCSSEPKSGWDKYLFSDEFSAEEFIDQDLLSTHFTKLSSMNFKVENRNTGGKKTVKYLIDSFQG